MKQAMKETRVFVSLATFKQKAWTVYDCESVSEIRKMTSDDYHPDCCTALLVE